MESQYNLWGFGFIEVSFGMLSFGNDAHTALTNFLKNSEMEKTPS